MKKAYILLYFILTGLLVTSQEINDVEYILQIKNTDVFLDMTYLPEPIFFIPDKSVIEASEFTKIESIVKYINWNSKADVFVTGYANKETGSDAYNMKLSEKRAKNVTKILVKKYKIDKKRIKPGMERRYNSTFLN